MILSGDDDGGVDDMTFSKNSGSKVESSRSSIACNIFPSVSYIEDHWSYVCWVGRCWTGVDVFFGCVSGAGGWRPESSEGPSEIVVEKDVVVL